MPVVVDPGDHADYGQFPTDIERDWLGRWCHLSEADVGLARRRAGDVTRLGFAVQLATVRAIGTFLADPTAVPGPIVDSVARQLNIGDPSILADYRELPVRWKHTSEIRRRYGYRDSASQPAHFSLLLWLYRQAWADGVGPSALFRAAHRRLLAGQVLLPGANVLARLVGSVRERATRRLWARLAQVASLELVERLEGLLVVREGKRRSELDRLRRPPFSPTITGLVQALERLTEVRTLGAGELDLSHLPPRRVAGLARYAEDAWVTQLAGLAPQRRVATLVRDDVIDIFDVVFGELQHAATNRGQKRRAGEQLARVLDEAWRRTAEGFATNPLLRLEQRDGQDRIVASPLDARDEPASLVCLRSMVEGLLPEVEIADVPLEVHSRTGFLDEYTHVGGAPARAAGLIESVSALLVSDACNLGLTPVADEHYLPLSRERLNWVAQNYLRSETHAGGNTRLVNYHARLALAQAWGGGEMASADGMRFVIPVSTIHAGYNPRYFGRQRGSTLYTWIADTHASFHQTLIPGTERGSLYALDGLMANQTVIRPETVSTDTAGASEIVFALAWTLGYRYAPRLADLPDQRLWRIDPTANYGSLDGLARNRINTALIASQWDQICRLTASLEARTVTPS